MAEQTVEETLKFFSIEDRVRFNRSSTVEPLNSKATIESPMRCRQQLGIWAEEFQQELQLVEKLADRHGEEAEDILRMYNSRVLKETLSGQELWNFEAHHAIDQTMCLGLRDFFLRRTPLFLAEKDHGWSFRESLADLFAERLGWTDTEREEQLLTLNSHLNSEMAWRNTSDAS
jgi:glycerol-3-phosphate dehydrogenase